MSQNLKAGLNFIITLAFVGGLVFYVFAHRQEFLSLRIKNPEFLWLGILSGISIFFLQGAINTTIFGALSCPAKYWDNFWLGVVSSAANLFLPLRGGLVLRAVYMKKLFHTTYTDYVVATLGYYLIVFVVTGLCTSTILIPLYDRQPSQAVLSMIFFAAAMVAAGMVLMMLPSIPEKWRHYKGFSLIAKGVQGWHQIKANRRAVWILVFLCILEALQNIMVIYSMVNALGISAGFFEVGVVAILGAFAALFSITPGGLGIYETVIALTGSALLINPAHSLSAALLYRAVVVVFLALTAPFGSSLLTKRITAD